MDKDTVYCETCGIVKLEENTCKECVPTTKVITPDNEEVLWDDNEER